MTSDGMYAIFFYELSLYPLEDLSEATDHLQSHLSGTQNREEKPISRGT
jgi:hypothetical protein